MKIVILILTFVIFYIARILSGHHENSLFKSHIKLKHKLPGYILIGKVPTSKTNIDRSKLLIQGIVIYALCIFTVLFCIYNLYFRPIIQEDILLVHGYMDHRRMSAPLIVHSVNEAVSLLMCAAILTLEVAMLFVEGMKAVYNNSEASTGNLIFSMLANLFMTIVFLWLSCMSVLRIITLLN
ncbi:MAG: hypothetical protein IJ435_08620 [Clostridia bacterium]|nr:hypothetical protein [Clostridia bacterium]